MRGPTIDRHSSLAGLQEKLEESLCHIYPPHSDRLRQPEQVNTEYFQSAFFLTNNGKFVARAILYHNPGISLEGAESLLVGNFESVNDKGYAAQLLARIESEAQKRGAAWLIGPMDGSTWDSYRFTVKAIQPFFLEPVHPLYYHELFADYGFKKIRPYISCRVDVTDTPDDAHERIGKFLEEKEISLRPIDLDHYEQELDRIHAFTLEAFATNFLFSPINREAFKQKYRKVKAMMHPTFTLLAQDSGHRLVGCIFCVDDLQNEKEKTLIIKSIARHPDPRWKGLGRLLTSYIHQKAQAAGYRAVIHAFMDGEGYSRPISATFAEEVINEYALYAKKIKCP